MAITSGQLTIGTTSSEISGHSVNHSKITIMNHEHGAGKRVWLGPANVTPLNGMLIGTEQLTVLLSPMEHLHAVTDSGTVLIGYLRQG